MHRDYVSPACAPNLLGGR